MLLVAMIVKYGFDNDAGVKVLGPIHGVLYLVYAAALLVSFEKLQWQATRLIFALFLGALPFGGLLVDRWWLAPLADSSASAESLAEG